MDDYRHYAAIDLATKNLATAWALFEALTAELTVEDVRARYDRDDLETLACRMPDPLVITDHVLRRARWDDGDPC